MAYTNFWERIERKLKIGYFREHMMKILGALLVPGALVGKHWATLIVYSFREGVNLTDIFDRSPNVQM